MRIGRIRHPGFPSVEDFRGSARAAGPSSRRAPCRDEDRVDAPARAGPARCRPASRRWRAPCRAGILRRSARSRSRPGFAHRTGQEAANGGPVPCRRSRTGRSRVPRGRADRPSVRRRPGRDRRHEERAGGGITLARESIDIAFRDRIRARERTRPREDVEDPGVLEADVDRGKEPVRLPFGRVEVHDLTVGVHARVSASGSVHPRGMSERPARRFLRARLAPCAPRFPGSASRGTRPHVGEGRGRNLIRLAPPGLRRYKSAVARAETSGRPLPGQGEEGRARGAGEGSVPSASTRPGVKGATGWRSA